MSSETPSATSPLVGVLALQGAFEEHQHCLEAVGCRTVRTPAQLEGIDGIVFPGGESTAMGLIGSKDGMWDALKEFVAEGKPTWGTCAGMVLLADRCVGGSAVITNGQSLIGGMDVLVCRNYFGSQVSSFEMATPCPPGSQDTSDYPGVFIRAPAILNAGADLNVLGRVVATPSRAAAVVLDELEKKIAAGENVIMMGVVDALQRTGTNGQHIDYKKIIKPDESASTSTDQEEKKESMTLEEQQRGIHLPGAADGTNAREVICAVRKDNVLCTAFHPELTEDYRWHEYFFNMVRNSSKVTEEESSS
eukprot:scaffold32535_cov44-Attheya_sp.AAC.3